MTLHSKRKQVAEKVKEKLTITCPAERLEALARQSAFVQRASSKMTGQDFLALKTTEMLEDPAVSLGGLCDLLRQRNPQAVMTPQALHQRLNTPHAVTYMQEVLQLVLRAQLEGPVRTNVSYAANYDGSPHDAPQTFVNGSTLHTP